MNIDGLLKQYFGEDSTLPIIENSTKKAYTLFTKTL